MIPRFPDSRHKKCSFPLRISSVNVKKFAGNCELVTFFEGIHYGKHFFSAVIIPRIGETNAVSILENMYCNI